MSGRCAQSIRRGARVMLAASYLTSITALVNDQGQTIHEIPSKTGDRGQYVLELDAKQSRGSKQSRVIFTVGGPPSAR